MNEHLQALGAFFLVLLASILSQRAEASVTVIPDVPGLTPLSAGYTPSLGQLQGTQPWSSGGYSVTGRASIGGKPLNIPAKVPLASGAGSLVKSAMRMNPYLLAGSLALPWLLDKGMEWVEGEGWMYEDPNAVVAPEDLGWSEAQSLPSCNASLACGPAAGYTCLWSADANAFTLITYAMGTIGPDGWSQANACHETQANPFQSPAYPTTKTSPSTRVPATPAHWDALPDPTEDGGIAGELPGASYMPGGAPVGSPQYEAGRYPVGEPYKAADGSTVQPMANVTNNYNTWNSVTVSTYNLTTHNAAGDPIPDPQIEPTSEEAADCETNPNSLGCAQFGEIPAPDVLPETQIPASTTVVPIGGPGVCPAAVTTTKFGLTWSYQPICDFAEAVKPFILGFAWLGFAYIVAGTVRT